MAFPTFTMKEEITYLTCFFLLCVFVIPIMLYHNNGNENPENYIFTKSYLRLTERDKAVVNSVQIIETFNKHNKSNQISLKDFFNAKPKELEKKYISLIPHPRANPIVSRINIENAWEQFDFVNGTTLKSYMTILPLKIDWRFKNAVTRVKTSQKCGACWAYAVIDTIESMAAIKHSSLSELSTKQMIYCNDYDMDCEGGDPFQLLRWLVVSKINIQTAFDYQNAKHDDKCLVDKPGIRVRDFSVNDFTDKEHLMLLHLTYHGPLLACVNALNWPNYSDGIITQNCSDQPTHLNHVVEIVGFDLTEEIPFYIIKNSWGVFFGIERGFIKIAIGRNICGIAEKVSAIVVE